MKTAIHQNEYIIMYIQRKKKKRLGNTFLIHPVCSLQENIRHNGLQKETMNLVPSWHHSSIFIFPQKDSPSESDSLRKQSANQLG